MERRVPRRPARVFGPSLTKQAMMEECDINKIMKRFERDGLVDHINQHRGNYGDFTDAPQSYHDAMNQILLAREMFGSLPSRIRKEFGNDPGEFIRQIELAAGDETVRRRLEELDILESKPTVDPEGPPAGPSVSEAPAKATEGDPKSSAAD